VAYPLDMMPNGQNDMGAFLREQQINGNPTMSAFARISSSSFSRTSARSMMEC
jgi:hypothetical protein